MFPNVDQRFKSALEANKKELEMAQIKPIDRDRFPFAQNGICVMIAPMGAGKTYTYMHLIGEQEDLGKQPIYETAVICSTSGKFDKTVKSLWDCIKKTKLLSISDGELMSWLDEYTEKSRLYNTLMKFKMSGYSEIDEEIGNIIKAGHYFARVPGQGVFIDEIRLKRYIDNKLAEFGWTTYPHRLLLILDDFASHPLLKQKDDPLSRKLKLLRHFMISCIICVQTVKSIPKDIKRNVTDFVLFPGISEFDFKDLIRESSASIFPFQETWNSYIQLKNKHDRFDLHVSARKITKTLAEPERGCSDDSSSEE